MSPFEIQSIPKVHQNVKAYEDLAVDVARRNYFNRSALLRDAGFPDAKARELVAGDNEIKELPESTDFRLYDGLTKFLTFESDDAFKVYTAFRKELNKDWMSTPKHVKYLKSLIAFSGALEYQSADFIMGFKYTMIWAMSDLQVGRVALTVPRVIKDSGIYGTYKRSPPGRDFIDKIRYLRIMKSAMELPENGFYVANQFFTFGSRYHVTMEGVSDYYRDLFSGYGTWSPVHQVLFESPQYYPVMRALDPSQREQYALSIQASPTTHSAEGELMRVAKVNARYFGWKMPLDDVEYENWLAHEGKFHSDAVKYAVSNSGFRLKNQGVITNLLYHVIANESDWMTMHTLMTRGEPKGDILERMNSVWADYERRKPS